jgi:hypothetical protein
VHAWQVAFTPPGPYHMLVGEMKIYTAKAGETFLDIGRREDLGIGELEEANPGVDPGSLHLALGDRSFRIRRPRAAARRS